MSGGPFLKKYAKEIADIPGVLDEGKALAFVDSQAAGGMFKELKALLKGEGINISAVSQDGALLEKAGIEGEVITHDAASGADVAADIVERFAKSYRQWYMLGDCDPTVISGLSLGSVYELDAYGLFRDAIWRLENIRAAIDRHRPAVMVAFLKGDTRVRGIEPFLTGGSGTRLVNVPPEAGGGIKRSELWLRLGYLGWLFRFVKAKAGAKPARPLDGGRYLFVYTGESASSIDSIASVSGEFNGDEVLHLAEGERTRKALEKRGVAGRLYEEFTGWGALTGVLTGRMPFMRAWRSAKLGLAGSSRFDYKGVNLYPLIIHELDRLMIKGVHNTLARAYALKGMLEGKKVRALLVATDFHPVPREAALLCRRYGAPSLEVVHGMAGVPAFYVPLTADKAAVWGDEMRDWFVRHGTEPGRLVVTGQPRYDSLARHEENKERIKAELGIGGDKKVVLYATCRLPGEINTVGMARDALAGRDDIVFIIKPHPGEKTGEYEKLINEKPGPRSMVVSGKNIFDMLAICDIVLLIFSGVGFEAVLMDKPLIIVSEGTAWDKGRFVDDGVAVRASGEGEIREAVEGILTGSERYACLRENRARYIYRNNYKSDGRAGRRVADCLAGMAAGKTGGPG